MACGVLPDWSVTASEFILFAFIGDTIHLVGQGYKLLFQVFLRMLPCSIRACVWIMVCQPLRPALALAALDAALPPADLAARAFVLSLRLVFMRPYYY